MVLLYIHIIFINTIYIFNNIFLYFLKGFVSSGHFSFIKNKGVGFGHIINNQFNLTKKNETILLLIRNKNSRYYFFANVKFM